MLICNLDNIPNQKFKVIGMTSGVGIAYGTSEQTVHNAENKAINEMKMKAEVGKADALIGVKLAISNNSNVFTVLASGTMIKFTDIM